MMTCVKIRHWRPSYWDTYYYICMWDEESRQYLHKKDDIFI